MQEQDEKFPWKRFGLALAPIVLVAGLQTANERGYISDPVTIARRVAKSIFWEKEIEQYEGRGKSYSYYLERAHDLIGMEPASVSHDFHNVCFKYLLDGGDEVTVRVYFASGINKRRCLKLTVETPIKDGIEAASDGLHSINFIHINDDMEVKGGNVFAVIVPQEKSSSVSGIRGSRYTLSKDGDKFVVTNLRAGFDSGVLSRLEARASGEAKRISDLPEAHDFEMDSKDTMLIGFEKRYRDIFDHFEKKAEEEFTVR